MRPVHFECFGIKDTNGCIYCNNLQCEECSVFFPQEFAEYPKLALKYNWFDSKTKERIGEKRLKKAYYSKYRDDV